MRSEHTSTETFGLNTQTLESDYEVNKWAKSFLGNASDRNIDAVLLALSRMSPSASQLTWLFVGVTNALCEFGNNHDGFAKYNPRAVAECVRMCVRSSDLLIEQRSEEFRVNSVGRGGNLLVAITRLFRDGFEPQAISALKFVSQSKYCCGAGLSRVEGKGL